MSTTTNDGEATQKHILIISVDAPLNLNAARVKELVNMALLVGIADAEATNGNPDLESLDAADLVSMTIDAPTELIAFDDAGAGAGAETNKQLTDRLGKLLFAVSGRNHGDQDDEVYLITARDEAAARRRFVEQLAFNVEDESENRLSDQKRWASSAQLIGTVQRHSLLSVSAACVLNADD